MKRTTIIRIVIWMCVALVGIIALQAYWIKQTIDSEARIFDRNVYESLNQAVEQVQLWDRLQRPEVQPLIQWHDYKRSGYARLGDQQFSGDSIASLSRGESLRLRTLAERINLGKLDTFLQERLHAHGIHVPMEYAIRIESNQQIIAYNGVPVQSQYSGKEWSWIRHSYSVPMFVQGHDPLGHLLVYFPKRTQLVWGRVWIMLLAAVVFSGIIMFSFIYTLRIVFRQKKISEMKTDFINNMTHEFKTPIATISLASETMMNPSVSADTEKVNYFAKIIHQENERMLSQVEKVLDIAHIDRHQYAYEKEVVDLHALLIPAIENIRIAVEKRGGTVRTQLDADQTKIMGDPTHVSNALYNLLDNANKYSPQSPQIVIQTTNDKQGILVSVQDAGIGLSKEERKHIFDKFYRAHTGNRHDVKGFGLGLSYVRIIMDAHRGQVFVQSEPGNGSKFTLRFPLVTDKINT